MKIPFNSRKQKKKATEEISILFNEVAEKNFS